jgi:hypothetical protein
VAEIHAVGMKLMAKRRGEWLKTIRQQSCHPFYMILPSCSLSKRLQRRLRVVKLTLTPSVIKPKGFRNKA